MDPNFARLFQNEPAHQFEPGTSSRRRAILPPEPETPDAGNSDDETDYVRQHSKFSLTPQVCVSVAFSFYFSSFFSKTYRSITCSLDTSLKKIKKIQIEMILSKYYMLLEMILSKYYMLLR